MQPALPLISVGLLALAMLAYEILLLHLFSIIQYHHFAYMIIGVALLGYGASGTFFSIFRTRIGQNTPVFFVICILLFACSSLGSFIVTQQIPFNGLELYWNPRQLFYLIEIFLLILLPFFFGSLAICTALVNSKGRLGIVYGADLLGSGLGCIALIFLLYNISPEKILVIVSALGFLAAISAVFELSFENPLKRCTAVIVLFATLLGVSVFWGGLKMSPYKGLMQFMQIGGSEIIERQSSPLGMIHVVENPKVPLRYAPGKSLMSFQEPLEQKGIFINGEGLSVITKATTQRDRLQYLDYTTTALPYHLQDFSTALILGFGGGIDLLLAKYHGVRNITGVELNPQIISLLEDRYAHFSGNVLSDVEVYNEDIRGFIGQSKRTFDIVQLALLDSFLPSSSGLYGLSENNLYTVEAIQSYLDHLTPEGYLSITRWIKNPPRDALKLINTAVTVLSNRGLTDLGKHLVLIRGWQTSTLLIKNSPFTTSEIGRVESFCRQRSFDIAYTSLATASLVNRYNILRKPLFFQGTTALLSREREQFINNYKYVLEPSTDDRPYFHDFFKWRTFSEIIGLKDRGGAALFESGYLMLFAVLLMVSFISFLLILLPLLFLPEIRKNSDRGLSTTRIIVYFFCAGLAYLFLEIGIIQKCILFLHHPVYAMGTGIGSFLIFSGCGSISSHTLAQRFGRKHLVWSSVFCISCLSTLYVFFLSDLLQITGGDTLILKVATAALFIAPLAFCMGIPFPVGLSNIDRYQPSFLPWAWGINGYGSVISSVLATVLSIHFGFSVVIASAVLLYLGVAVSFPLSLDNGELNTPTT